MARIVEKRDGKLSKKPSWKLRLFLFLFVFPVLVLSGYTWLMLYYACLSASVREKMTTTTNNELENLRDQVVDLQAQVDHDNVRRRELWPAIDALLPRLA